MGSIYGGSISPFSLDSLYRFNDTIDFTECNTKKGMANKPPGCEVKEHILPEVNTA